GPHPRSLPSLTLRIVISGASSQFSVLSSQFSVLSSQFSVLSSQFSVLSSQFSVLSSQFSKLCTGLKFVAWCSAVTDDFSGPCQDECGGGHGKVLSRAGGVAESHAVGNRDLSGNENLSDRGAIWPHELRRAAVSVPSNIAEGQA